MSKLTGTHSEASEIDFTTLTTVPGTLKVHGAPIQILDLRAFSTSLSSLRIHSHSSQLGLLRVQTTVEVEVDKVRPCLHHVASAGNLTCSVYISHCRYASKHPYLSSQLTSRSVARTCHLIFIVLDVLKPLGDKAVIESELEGFGIRLNKKPPAITVRKKDKGGIAITNTVPLTNIDHDEIKAVLSEYRINNADVAIRQPNATADDLVDVIEGNRCARPSNTRWQSLQAD